MRGRARRKRVLRAAESSIRLPRRTVKRIGALDMPTPYSPPLEAGVA
jgi:hypothetical protein